MNVNKDQSRYKQKSANRTDFKIHIFSLKNYDYQAIPILIYKISQIVQKQPTNVESKYALFNRSRVFLSLTKSLIQNRAIFA